jgi:hypothetical protein
VDKPLQRELEVLAEKYDFGAMAPEGDGWGWYFAPSDSGMAALREAFEMGVRYQMGAYAAEPLRDTEGHE